MELRCPQCGKWMAVSQEELVMHDCQVVCPQCLAICQYEGGALVVRDDSDAPYRHNANASTNAPQHETSRFCHGCGKQLPAGISFCPYCGADLNAPFEEPKTVAPVIQPEPEPKRQVQPQRQVEPQRQEPVREKKQPEPVHESPARQESSSHVEDKLRTMSRHYSGAHHHMHEDDTMPGTTFKIIAYAVIIALLILLAYIIIAGASIEMPD